MNAVIYCSCTGHSKAIAENLAENLNYTLVKYSAATDSYSTAVVVFPVHCQSFPVFLKKFFKELKAERVALVATYGKAHAGNAVYEAAKLVSGKIIAAAYIPAGHSYSGDGYIPEKLPQELIDKILKPSSIDIPKRKKTPFAGFLPSLRSRFLVKIKRTEKCVGCNICGDGCPAGAIARGKISSECVRCLKCVYSCPEGALKIKKARILTRYLKTTKCNETILFI